MGCEISNDQGLEARPMYLTPMLIPELPRLIFRALILWNVKDRVGWEGNSKVLMQ